MSEAITFEVEADVVVLLLQVGGTVDVVVLMMTGSESSVSCDLATAEIVGLVMGIWDDESDADEDGLECSFSCCLFFLVAFLTGREEGGGLGDDSTSSNECNGLSSTSRGGTTRFLVAGLEMGCL